MGLNISVKKPASDLMGHQVSDKVTGFTGTVVGWVTYITGCNQCLVVPPARDGKMQGSEWIDEQRLRIESGSQKVTIDNGSNPGCDIPPPKR